MNTAKICTQCGAPLPDNGDKCEYCGTCYSSDSAQHTTHEDRWMDAEEIALAAVVLMIVAAILIAVFVIAAERGWK